MAFPYAVRRIAERLAAVPPESIGGRLRYSTFVSLERKYLYFEVPKAGCSAIKALIHSIEKLPPIVPFVGPAHETRRDMFIHDRTQFKLPSLLDFDDATQRQILDSPEFFRFSIVRDPYARLASAWKDKVQLCVPGYEVFYHRLGRKLPDLENPDSVVSFAEFVAMIAEDDLDSCNLHWRRQCAHLFQPALEFSHVGRFERFGESVRRFLDHVGQPDHAMPLAHNRSFGAASYTAELASQVHALYREDFAQFGYEAAGWQAPAAPAEAPRMVPERRLLHEVRERNIVIGALYAERDRLAQRVRIAGEAAIERYRDMDFAALFAAHITGIEGWLSIREAELLYDCARVVSGGDIVEIGSYRGRATAALAFGAIAGGTARVVAIDPQAPWVGPNGARFGPMDRGSFMQKMVELRLFHRVSLINLDSTLFADRWPDPVALAVFDGDRSYAGAARDFRAWQSRLAVGAKMIFNTAPGPDGGAEKLIRELTASGYRITGRAGTYVEVQNE